ncbi:MAG TPA: PHP domain-containing protein, partial [Herpetosiphonaceae bacterium]
EAASEGRLRTVKGFGAKTEARILEAIARYQSRSGRLRLGDALPIAEELVAALRNAAEADQLALAGSLRRGDSTVRNLDLVAAAADPAALLAAFTALPQVAAVVSSGAGSAAVTLHNGFQADLAVVAPGHWGTALQFRTGSREHHALLAPLAAARGLAFGANGLRDAQGAPDGAPSPFASEEEVYAALGLPWIPPELRNGWDEVERALAGTLPALLEQRELRADLHWHTEWSDGRAPLRAMAEAGRLLGYSHMSVADHSAYLGVTNGLDPARLRAQRAEIDALNAEFAAQGLGFRLLQGCEVDILPDGSLALPDETLAELDVVIASPHTGLRQPRAESTARLIRAIQHPHVDLIGHPTGRLINERDGADLDMEAVLDAAAAAGTALEINASPERLDLDAPLARQALRRGIRLSINTDAHAPGHLAAVGLGVLTARRSGARAEDILNTWSYEQLTDWLRTHKS